MSAIQWNYDMSAAPRDDSYILLWIGESISKGQAYVGNWNTEDHQWYLRAAFWPDDDTFLAWAYINPPEVKP